MSSSLNQNHSKAAGRLSLENIDKVPTTCQGTNLINKHWLIMVPDLRANTENPLLSEGGFKFPMI